MHQKLCIKKPPPVFATEVLHLLKRRYCHISKVQLLSHQIWTPNINVYYGEMVDTNVLRGASSSLPVTVSINGRVTMKRYVTIKTPCAVNTTKYPFDIHQCNFKLGVRDLKQNDVKVSVSKMNYYSIRSNSPDEPEDLTYIGAILNFYHTRCIKKTFIIPLGIRYPEDDIIC